MSRGFSDCCHYDEGYDDGYEDGKQDRFPDKGVDASDAALFAAERLGAIRTFLVGPSDVLAEVDDVIDHLERAVGLAQHATFAKRPAA